MISSDLGHTSSQCVSLHPPPPQPDCIAWEAGDGILLHDAVILSPKGAGRTEGKSVFYQLLYTSKYIFYLF